MHSSLHLNPATVTAAVNDLLGRSTTAKARSITCVREADQVRLSINGIQTGVSVFGMALPAIDAELLVRGLTDAEGVLRLTWSVERVVGIPAMAAKLVGKPALAKMLRDAVGATWGLDAALTADEAGDLLLTLSLLRIPICANLQIRDIFIPATDGYVLKIDFSWNA